MTGLLAFLAVLLDLSVKNDTLLTWVLVLAIVIGVIWLVAFVAGHFPWRHP